MSIDSYILLVNGIVHHRINKHFSRRRALANDYTKTPVVWSCDSPRTREGFYHYSAVVDKLFARVRCPHFAGQRSGLLDIWVTSFNPEKVANDYTKTPVVWSCDSPRTREGFYHYSAGFPAATTVE
jgi:hypothetical protein